MEPAKEFTSFTRTELEKKSVWCYNNISLAGRAIDAPARYAVGTGIKPQARSSDRTFNDAVENLFHDTVGTTSFAFDLAGDLNFYQGQETIIRQMALGGDFFLQLVLSDAGAGMVRFIPGGLCGNGSDTKATENGWEDGIKCNKYGRPIKYRFLKDWQGKDWADVDAADVIHVKRPSRYGRRRGVPWLHRVIGHMHDTAEMVAYTKQAFKLASQVAFAVKSAEGITMGPTFPGTKQLGSAGQDSKVKVTGNYSAAGYLNLKPEESLQMFKNEHPGDSFDPMMSYLARDIAWGVDISPEVLWDITGASGAGVRYSVADTQVFIEQLQQLVIDLFCRRFYKFWLWHEIESGRIPNAPADWYRVEWVTPRKLTVDFGRDSKALMEMVLSGRMSSRRFAEMHGWDDEQEDSDSIRGIARRKKMVEQISKEEGVEVEYEEVFGSGKAAASAAPEPVEPAEPADPANPKSQEPNTKEGPETED